MSATAPTASASTLGILRERVGKLWDQAQDHPFVHGIADGSLPREAFIHYLKQDYVYCVGFCRAAALAGAKAESVAEMQLFSAMVSAVLSSELEVHRGYCAEFGITPAQLEATPAAPTCRAYVDFCIAAAAINEPAALLAALSPCAIGYAEIGARLAAATAGQDSHPYRRWIDNYGGAEYQGFAQLIAAELDRMGSELPLARLDAMTELFAAGCRYEWMFWEMAWSRQEWPL